MRRRLSVVHESRQAVGRHRRAPPKSPGHRVDHVQVGGAGQARTAEDEQVLARVEHAGNARLLPEQSAGAQVERLRERRLGIVGHHHDNRRRRGHDGDAGPAADQRRAPQSIATGQREGTDRVLGGGFVDHDEAGSGHHHPAVQPDRDAREKRQPGPLRSRRGAADDQQHDQHRQQLGQAAPAHVEHRKAGASVRLRLLGEVAEIDKRCFGHNTKIKFSGVRNFRHATLPAGRDRLSRTADARTSARAHQPEAAERRHHRNPNTPGNRLRPGIRIPEPG